MAKNAKSPNAFRQKAWDPLNAIYADLSHPEWMQYQHLPPRFWEDTNNHKRYMKWIASELGIETLDDWYQVSTKDFQQRRGGGLLRAYNFSHIQAITTLIRRKAWYIWKFKYVPRKFWLQRSNRVAYLKWLEKELGYQKPSDWYEVTSQDFRQHHGKVLEESGTASEILSELYPNVTWYPWKFTLVERSFWKKKANRLRYFNWLRKIKRLKTNESLYKLSKQDFSSNHGRAFIDYYNSSTIKAVRDCVPDYPWIEWKFNRLPSEYWNKKKNRLRYLQWLSEELGFDDPDDWYQISERLLRCHYGTTLLDKIYGGMPQRAAYELFPKRTWYPWMFVQTPKRFWEKKENRLKYMKWLGKLLGIKKRSDWNRVKQADFLAHHGHRLTAIFKYQDLIEEYLS